MLGPEIQIILLIFASGDVQLMFQAVELGSLNLVQSYDVFHLVAFV